MGVTRLFLLLYWIPGCCFVQALHARYPFRHRFCHSISVFPPLVKSRRSAASIRCSSWSGQAPACACPRGQSWSLAPPSFLPGLFWILGSKLLQVHSMLQMFSFVRPVQSIVAAGAFSCLPEGIVFPVPRISWPGHTVLLIHGEKKLPYHDLL